MAAPAHTVWDREPDEPPLLSTAVAEFIAVVLSWLLLAWLLRICLVAMQITDLRAALRADRVSIFKSVPMHALAASLDPHSRSRFISYLRARAPTAPTAAVPSFSNPVRVHSATLLYSGGVAVVELRFDCAVAGTLRAYWGISALPAQRMLRAPPPPPKAAAVAAEGSSAVASSSTAAQPVRRARTASGNSAAATWRPTRTSLSSTAPAAEASGSASRGSLLERLDGALRPSASRLRSSKGRLAAQPDAIQMSGVSMQLRESSDGTGDRAVESWLRAALPRAAYIHASPTQKVEGGAEQVVQLREAFLPPPGMIGAALRESVCLMLVFSGFSGSAPSPVAVAASCSTSQRSLLPSRNRRSAAATASADALTGTAAPLPAALREVPAQHVLCTIVQFVAPEGVNDVDESGRPTSPICRSLSGELDSSVSSGGSGSALGAHGQAASGAGDHPEAAAPSHPQQDPLAPPSEATVIAHPLAPAPAPNRSDGSPDAGNALPLRLSKNLVMTPTAILELQDIFGLADYMNSPECVACMTDPKDTILLPCRHLCICRSCFNHLTLDKCPVCRASFSSYLRFDVNERDFEDAHNSAGPAVAARSPRSQLMTSAEV